MPSFEKDEGTRAYNSGWKASLKDIRTKNFVKNFLRLHFFFFPLKDRREGNPWPSLIRKAMTKLTGENQRGLATTILRNGIEERGVQRGVDHSIKILLYQRFFSFQPSFLLLLSTFFLEDN